MNSVRRAQRERSASAETGVSGFHALTLSPNAGRIAADRERSASTLRRANAEGDLDARSGLRVELESARAELSRAQQELELIRAQLELSREENELLRQSLRALPASGPICVAPRVADPDDDFEVVTLDALEFDRPELEGSDSPELDSPKLDSPKLDSPKLDSPKLDSPKLDGRELVVSPPTRVEVPRQLDLESQGAFPVLRNLVLRASEAAPSRDRRGEARHGCEIEVEFADESHFFAGLTQDISRGGLFVSTYHLLPVGSRLSLRFELPNGAQIEVLGQVRWVLDSDADSRPGIGIEFVQASPEVLKSIADFCAARPPLYFDTVAPSAS